MQNTTGVANPQANGHTRGEAGARCPGGAVSAHVRREAIRRGVMDAHPVTVVGVFGLMTAGSTSLFHAVARGWDIARVRLAPAHTIGSAVVGRVALSGRAEAPEEIADPVFGDRCLW